jgi:flagellar biosynthetic protein FlhB
MSDAQAETDQKEFDASEQKLDRAREEGDVFHSRELDTLGVYAGLLTVCALWQALGGPMMFLHLRAMLGEADTVAQQVFAGDGGSLDGLLLPLLAVSLAALLVLAVPVIIVMAVQRSVVVVTKRVLPDLKRISPANHLKQKYGARGLSEFGFSLVKTVIISILVGVFLLKLQPIFFQTFFENRSEFLIVTSRHMFNLLLILLGFQTALAAVDTLLQRQLYRNRQRMTREEVKREFKESEGDPHMKQERRKKAAKLSKSQMLANVRDATVVMTNPEHFAVALRWDPASGRAPVCVAKGVDHLAASIREAAVAAGVPLYRDPPTARSLYRLLDVDDEIKPEHFAAVVAAIQFVEQVRAGMGVSR